MTYCPTVEEIEATVDRCVLLGDAEVMRRHEEQRGFKPLSPGDASWFSAEDWPQDVVVSLDGKRVRIVAVYTLRPGNGAFSRLVTAICRAGLTPTIIAPMGLMVEILTAWGWHSRVIGKTFDDRCDEWFPTRKWRDERAA